MNMKIGEKDLPANENGLTRKNWLADELTKGFISQVERELTSPLLLHWLICLNVKWLNLKDFLVIV